MKSRSRLVRYSHALQSSLCLMSPTCRTRPTSPTRSVRPSPTESNPVQPNPTTPPPTGKEIGKETVKFLALFDHRFLVIRVNPTISDQIRLTSCGLASRIPNLQPATCSLQHP